MAPKIFFEVYDSEEALEEFINDPITQGMTPISIYQIPSKKPSGYEIVIWWRAEDAQE